jgi:hypothetical protein
MVPKFSDTINMIMKVSIILPFCIIGGPAIMITLGALIGVFYQHICEDESEGEFWKDIKEAFLPMYVFLLSATHTIEFMNAK